MFLLPVRGPTADEPVISGRAWIKRRVVVEPGLKQHGCGVGVGGFGRLL